MAIVMILAETFRADRAPLQIHANAFEDSRRQAAQNVVIEFTHTQTIGFNVVL